MADSLKTIAVIAASPALSSLLTSVLAVAPSLRVRQFETREALLAYYRIAPIHLIVADFDCAEAPADLLARDLRRDPTLPGADLTIIALTRALDPTTSSVCTRCGIDEVIVKPMSPRYLLERVLARTRRLRRLPLPPVRRDLERAAARAAATPRWGGNVVELAAYRAARASVGDLPQHPR